MRRDPTEFRKRFAKWKAGKRTKDIYRLGDQDYYEYMENLADKKATEWNDVPFKADPDIQLIKMLNDNTYNYKEFYNTNRYEANGMLYANPDVHFTDSGKTVYHPTFSEESNYSGKKSDYNPEGIVGGSWTDSSFNVSPQQATSRYFSERRTKNYLKRNDPNIKLKLPKYADGTEGDDWYKYVQAGKNNEWSRITDDDMSQVFQDIVARPKSRGGNTTVGNWTRQWSPKYEKPLETVSPEFDIISGIRGITNIIPSKKTTISPILQNADRTVVKGSGPYYAEENLKKYIAHETLSNPATNKIEFFTDKPTFQLYKGIYDMPVSEDVKQIYNNSILPRLQFMRPGYHGGIMRPTVKSHIDHTLERGYTVYPEQVFKDAGESVNTAGLHFQDTGHIAIKEGEQNFAIGHELRHRLDRTLKLTDDELDILLDAYDPSFSVLNQTDEGLKHVANMNREMVTTNFDVRKKLLGDYHLKNTPVNLQNKIIDKSTDQQIFDALENANGYGYAYVKQLKKDNKLTPEFANYMRKSLKYVGAFSMPIIFTQYKNNN